MDKRITEIRLRNFTLAREFDRELFEWCLRISPGMDTVIQACQKELRDLRAQASLDGEDRATRDNLSPHEIRYWMQQVLEAKIEFAELFSLLAALDVKMSLLAMNLDASYRGWLQKLGVDASDPFRTCPPPTRRPQKPHLRLVKS